MAKNNSKIVKPEKPTLSRLEVVRSARVSPNFVRVTLTGEDLAEFQPMGWDQWFRLFLPQSHQVEPKLPTSTGNLWWPQVLAMGKDKPHVRNYTLREFRPESLELDIDFVVHGEGVGIASDWARTAPAGARAGILDQGISFVHRPDADWHFLVADESGLPAVANVARDLPRDSTGVIIVEVPDADDARDLHEPAGMEVRWIARDHHAAPGVSALAAAKEVKPEGSNPSIYSVGESSLPTGLRRHLVSQGVPKNNIYFCGYWRVDAGRDENTQGESAA